MDTLCSLYWTLYSDYLMFMTLGLQAMTCLISLDSCSCTTPPVWPMILFFFSRFSSSKPSTHLDAPAPQWGGKEGGRDIPRLLQSSPNTSFLDICHLGRFMEGGKIQLKICFFFDTDFSPKMRSKSHNPTQPLHLDQLHAHASKIMVLINSTFHFLFRALKTTTGPSPPAVGATLVVLTPRGPDDLSSAENEVYRSGFCRPRVFFPVLTRLSTSLSVRISGLL